MTKHFKKVNWNPVTLAWHIYISLIFEKQTQVAFTFWAEPLIYILFECISICFTLYFWGKESQICVCKLFRLLVPYFLVLAKFTCRFDDLFMAKLVFRKVYISWEGFRLFKVLKTSKAGIDFQCGFS